MEEEEYKGDKERECRGPYRCIIPCIPFAFFHILSTIRRTRIVWGAEGLSEIYGGDVAGVRWTQHEGKENVGGRKNTHGDLAKKSQWWRGEKKMQRKEGKRKVRQWIFVIFDVSGLQLCVSLVGYDMFFCPPHIFQSLSCFSLAYIHSHHQFDVDDLCPGNGPRLWSVGRKVLWRVLLKYVLNVLLCYRK